MVQAHIVTQLLEGRCLPIPPLWLVLVLYGGCAALGAALTRLDWPVWLSLSLIVTALAAFWALGFWWYREGGALLPLICLSPGVAGRGLVVSCPRQLSGALPETLYQKRFWSLSASRLG